MKICKKCNLEKDETNFPFKDKKIGRYDSQCKTCANNYQKQRLLKNPEIVKNKWKESSKKYWNSTKAKVNKRLRIYGISQKEYDEIVKRQNGKCQICNESKQLVIDHCHITGKVRGLLCHHCNIGIGNLKDNIELLKKAIEYLIGK